MNIPFIKRKKNMTLEQQVLHPSYSLPWVSPYKKGFLLYGIGVPFIAAYFVLLPPAKTKDFNDVKLSVKSDLETILSDGFVDDYEHERLQRYAQDTMVYAECIEGNEEAIDLARKWYSTFQHVGLLSTDAEGVIGLKDWNRERAHHIITEFREKESRFIGLSNYQQAKDSVVLLQAGNEAYDLERAFDDSWSEGERYRSFLNSCDSALESISHIKKSKVHSWLSSLRDQAARAQTGAEYHFRMDEFTKELSAVPRPAEPGQVDHLRENLKEIAKKYGDTSEIRSHQQTLHHLKLRDGLDSKAMDITRRISTSEPKDVQSMLKEAYTLRSRYGQFAIDMPPSLAGLIQEIENDYEGYTSLIKKREELTKTFRDLLEKMPWDDKAARAAWVEYESIREGLERASSGSEIHDLADLITAGSIAYLDERLLTFTFDESIVDSTYQAMATRYHAMIHRLRPLEHSRINSWLEELQDKIAHANTRATYRELLRSIDDAITAHHASQEAVIRETTNLMIGSGKQERQMISALELEDRVNHLTGRGRLMLRSDQWLYTFSNDTLEQYRSIEDLLTTAQSHRSLRDRMDLVWAGNIAYLIEQSTIGVEGEQIYRLSADLSQVALTSIHPISSPFKGKIETWLSRINSESERLLIEYCKKKGIEPCGKMNEEDIPDTQEPIQPLQELPFSIKHSQAEQRTDQTTQAEQKPAFFASDTEFLIIGYNMIGTSDHRNDPRWHYGTAIIDRSLFDIIASAYGRKQLGDLLSRGDMAADLYPHYDFSNDLQDILSFMKGLRIPKNDKDLINTSDYLNRLRREYLHARRTAGSSRAKAIENVLNHEIGEIRRLESLIKDPHAITGIGIYIQDNVDLNLQRHQSKGTFGVRMTGNLNIRSRDRAGELERYGFDVRFPESEFVTLLVGTSLKDTYDRKGVLNTLKLLETLYENPTMDGDLLAFSKNLFVYAMKIGLMDNKIRKDIYHISDDAELMRLRAFATPIRSDGYIRQPSMFLGKTIRTTRFEYLRP